MKNTSSHLINRAIETFKTQGVRGLWRRGWAKLRHNTRQWTFRPYVIKKSICGEAIVFQIGDPCAQGWYDRVHAWPELMWLKEHALNADDIVVDCGAHHGLTTVLFSKWASAGKVFGYEAHPRNAEIAQKNLALNQADNARIRACAVGDSPGSIRISDHSNSASLKSADANGIEVPRVALDSEFPSTAPTFIKIDVEGQELNVLRGARRILRTRPKLDIEIHCSLHTDPTREVEKIFDLISINDYRAFIQLEVDGTIREFNPGLHTAPFISRYEVVHLFCLPRP